MRLSLLWSLVRTWKLLSDGLLALLLAAGVAGFFWFVGQLLANPTAADPEQPVFSDAANGSRLRPATRLRTPAAPVRIR